MPHFIIEYSANLKEELDVPLLMEKLNDTAIKTGVFPIGGIRTRAICHEEYRVAEGDPENRFIYFTARVGSGRDIEVLKAACDKIFETITEFLQPVFDKRYLSIGFEMQEIHPVLTYKQNNIHEKFK
jgi:5-carboxymethyl-2-hydroxymuconate isomerase